MISHGLRVAFEKMYGELFLSNSISGDHTALPGGGTAIHFAAASTASNGTIILLPAIAGVNAYIEARAAALARSGYDCLLLDYYARTGETPDLSSPQKIGAAVGALSDVQVLGDLKESLALASGKVGVMGFCIGGMYAFMAAAKFEAVSASVDYYGSIRYAETSGTKPEDPFGMIGDLAAPVLCHFGDYDRLISEAEISALRNRLREAHKPFEMYVYSGAPHAFDEDFRPEVYRPAASAEAWQRSLTFFNWHLDGQPGRD